MNSQALEPEIARGYHFPLEAIIFSPRLSFSPRGYHFPLEAIIFPSRLSFSPRGYHFPLEAIIFPSRLSFSPRGYHFPLEAIIFASRLSFSPRGYHFPLASLVLQVSHGGIYFNRKFVSQRNWKPPSLTAVLLCLTFCLLFSSCKRSATQCWLKVPPREWQSYPKFSPRGFDFSRKETTLIPRHSSRCSCFQCSAAKPEVTCSKGKPWFDWVR